MSERILLFILVALVVILIIIMPVLFIYLFKKSKTKPNNQTDISNFPLLDKTLSNSNEVVKNIITEKLHEFEKAQNEKRIKELEKYNESVGKIISLKEEITNSFTSFKENQAKTISDNLEKNFGQTKEIIENITQRLTKIDSVQTQITDFKETIDDFNRVLTDKKARGNFGEFQLEAMFSSTVGETENSIFKRQVKLSNNNIVDGLLTAPGEIGNIPIDSKFPLDNYRAMISAKTKQEKDVATNAFKKDCEAKIKDISEKYIVKGETSDFAFMFIPAEAVFIELHSFEFKTVIDLAKKMDVYIVSPSTLFIAIQEIYRLYKEIKIKENLKPILKELSDLNNEFRLFKERWGKFVSTLKSEEKAIENLDITQGKIVKKIDKINILSQQGKLIELVDPDVTEEQQKN